MFFPSTNKFFLVKLLLEEIIYFLRARFTIVGLNRFFRFYTCFILKNEPDMFILRLPIHCPHKQKF